MCDRDICFGELHVTKKEVLKLRKKWQHRLWTSLVSIYLLCGENVACFHFFSFHTFTKSYRIILDAVKMQHRLIQSYIIYRCKKAIKSENTPFQIQIVLSGLQALICTRTRRRSSPRSGIKDAHVAEEPSFRPRVSSRKAWPITKSVSPVSSVADHRMINFK